MSKLGRRLVFVLLSLSLTLMGVSMAVNATATDWKGKLKKQADEKARLSTELDVITKAIEAEQKELEAAKALKDSQDKSYGARIAQVSTRLQTSKNALTKTHAEYQESQTAFAADLKTQEGITQTLKNLQAQIAAIEKQKASFDTQNQELTDLVSQLEREVQALTRAGELLKTQAPAGR